MKTRYCFLHDQLIEYENAGLPVQDRGFRFGDGLFETLRIERGVPLFWEKHMARLHEGLRVLGIMPPQANVQNASKTLIHANQVSSGILRISISRGVGSRGYMPHDVGPPTLLIEAMHAPNAPDEGISLWLSDVEKISPRALPVHLKLAQGMNAMLARMDAAHHGCDEAIMLNAQGELTEASSGNLFWWKHGQLYTPALDCGVLTGITRSIVMTLEAVEETHATVSALEDAEGVFICNASMGLRPCQSLSPRGWQWPTPQAFHQLRTRYQDTITHYIHEHSSQW